jgi:hypothetical protein
MVDAVTVLGAVGTVATTLMVFAMLYLTVLGMRSDRQASDTDSKE